MPNSMRVDIERLEQRVREFYEGLLWDEPTIAEMCKVTENRPPLPEGAHRNLRLTKEQQDSIFITEADREYAATGISTIAALLTVHPDDYSDWQYYKVLHKGLHEMTLEELDCAIRDERMSNSIYFGEYIETEDEDYANEDGD